MLPIAGYSDFEQLCADSDSVFLRARASADGAPVLIKTLPATATPLQINRLHHELATLVLLQNCPSTMVPRAFFADHHALVFGDVAGLRLDTIMRVQRLPLLPFLEIAIAMAQALGALHTRTVIHKAISPTAFWLDADSRTVHLIDFGVASRSYEEDAEDVDPTLLEGRVAYMSPEQTGRIGQPIDSRTDLYGLGATLYEMLTGVPPFAGDDPLTLVHSHLAKVVLPPSHVVHDMPDAVSDIILKCLAKSADERYQSAPGLCHDLQLCRDKILRDRRLERFGLGAYDTSTYLRAPRKVYGRDRETRLLVDAFARAGQGGPECVAVSGANGVGKSSLVLTALRPLVRRNAYFAAAKFARHSAHIPYHGISMLCRELIAPVLQFPDDIRDEFVRDLRAAVDPNVHFLLALVDELRPILGTAKASPDAGPLEARNRLTLAVRRYLSRFARKGAPLVLFLDDVQWADAPSLKLIAEFCTACPYLLLVAAYPGGAGTGAVPPSLAELQAAVRAHQTSVVLQNLSAEHVGHYLSDTLATSDASVERLAARVTYATDGNPLHAVQLVRALWQDGLLSCDLVRGMWRWDLAQLEPVTERQTFITLLGARVGTLPPACQDALRWAGCIGPQFDLRWLAAARKIDVTTLVDNLWPAVQAGLVQPIAGTLRRLRDLKDTDTEPLYYRMNHDTTAAAAEVLFTPQYGAAAHLVLAAAHPRPNADLAVFSRVYHVQRAVQGGATTLAEHTRLFSDAGQRAWSLSAFAAMAACYEVVQAALPVDRWQSHYETIRRITLHLADGAFVDGDLAAGDKLFAQATAHAQSVPDRADILRRQIMLHANRGKQAAAIDLGIAALRDFGVSLPLRPTWPYLAWALWHNLQDMRRYRRRGVEVAQFATLAPSTQPEHVAAESILLDLAVSSHGVNDPRMYLSIAINSLGLGLRFGSPDLAAVGCLGYALVNLLVLKRIEVALKFARAAVQEVPDRTLGPIEAMRQLVYTMLFHHLEQDVQQCAQRYATLESACLARGDVMWASYASSMRVMTRIHAGEAVSDLLRDARHAVLLQEYGNTLMLQRYIHFLQKLNGDQAMHAVEESMEPASREDSPWDRCHGMLLEMQLAYLLGDAVTAWRIGNTLDHTTFLGTLHYPDQLFYHALSATAAAREAGTVSRRACMRVLRRSLRNFAAWTNIYPRNFAHKHTLLKAEDAALHGDFGLASKLYDVCIVEAKERGFMQDAAIANMCATRFALEFKRRRLAKLYAVEARALLRRWGATALAGRFSEAYAELLFRDRTTADKEGSISNATLVFNGSPEHAAAFDISEVVRAYQTLSAEIVLHDLLLKMMQIVLDIGHAQRALFYLAESPGWKLAATGDLEKQVYTIMPTMLSADHSAPLSIVQDLSTMQSMNYFKNTNTKSVLCLPVQHNGVDLGILYLEQRGRSDASAAQRLLALRLVLSQAALAIHNAQRYADVEQRLLQRTAAVRRAHQSVVAATRDGAEKTLADNFAHEICNVLAGSKMFLDAAVEAKEDTGTALFDKTADALMELFSAAREGLTHQQRMAIATDLRDITDSELRLNEMLQLVARANNRALDVTQQIVEFSRLGEQAHGMARIDLSRLLGQLVEEARLEFAADDIQIDSDFAGDIFVVGTEAHCYSVLRNLLQNARDALRDVSGRQRTIGVKGRATGTEVQIQIADNGSGIAPAVRERIFDSFFSTKPNTGTGLGLPMVKKIVLLYGGRIQVDSEPGVSTEFTITLPQASAES